jgi:pimeloyl-ACP methyl ester carboxylesterase
MQTNKNNDLGLVSANLNYISQGKGLPLVFQHGLTASVDQVVGLLGGLQGCHLLSIDCPGHGKTKLPKSYTPSFDAYADEIIKLLDQMRMGPAIFGGISMGSGIAVNIALRYPDRVKALVLVRPAWLDQSNPENLQILLPAAELLNTAEGETKFKQLDEFRDISLDSVAQSVLGVFSPDQQPGLAKVIKHMVGDRPFASMNDLKSINIPCLILGNDDDPLHPYNMAEKICESIEGSVLRKLTSRYIDDDLHRKQVRKNIQQFIVENKLHL